VSYVRVLATESQVDARAILVACAFLFSVSPQDANELILVRTDRKEILSGLSFEVAQSEVFDSKTPNF
jgi:hypothetical protein